MKIIHIIIGAKATEALQIAMQSSEALAGTIVSLNDDLHLGNLLSEDKNFNQTRKDFWAKISDTNTDDNQSLDTEAIMKVSTELSNKEDAVAKFWLAPKASDVCAYFFTLHFLKKHVGKVQIININGLPFLNEENKLFYPTDFSELTIKEFTKALKLARTISPAEWEIDGDEWFRLLNENAALRILKGGKKIESVAADYYDEEILKYCNGQLQKGQKIVNQVLNKAKLPLNEPYIIWRLKELAANQFLIEEKGEWKINVTTQEENKLSVE